MKRWTYPGNGSSLELDGGKCTACGACVQVCPHAVFAIGGNGADMKRVARVLDRPSCMECGACARNCPAGAITVSAGVGCAAAIINGKLRGTAPDCGCGGSACCG